MKTRVLKRLEDARAAGVRIRHFTRGLDRWSFQSDELVRSAVERQLEIIGEALGKALSESPDLAGQLPEIHRAIGLRNRLIHGYDSVDEEIVWDVIQSKLPPLVERLAQILATDESA